MPLQRRVPKRGFHNHFKTIFQVVNIEDLKRFPKDAEVNVVTLCEVGLLSKSKIKVKLLGGGEIDRPLKITVDACTKSAKERVEEAGGQIQIIEPKPTKKKKKKK